MFNKLRSCIKKSVYTKLLGIVFLIMGVILVVCSLPSWAWCAFGGLALIFAGAIIF